MKFRVYASYQSVVNTNQLYVKLFNIIRGVMLLSFSFLMSNRRLYIGAVVLQVRRASDVKIDECR